MKLSEALKELPEVHSYKKWEKISPQNRGLWCAWHYGLSFAQAIEDCIVISPMPHCNVNPVGISFLGAWDLVRLLRLTIFPART